MRQIRFALRTLFRTPFVTTVAILSLALGIGANAAMFSLVDQVLLKALPVPDPGRLVNLSAPGPKPGSTSCSNAGDCSYVFSYPMFRDLERDQTVFTGIAAHRGFGASLAYHGQTKMGAGLEVSGSYFPTLGVQPLFGRLLDSHDDPAIGESRVVVLSHQYWQSRFGERRDVLNDTLVVNGQTLTIVGVAAPGFTGTTFGDPVDVFVPITLRALVEANFKGFESRRTYWAYLFARLKPGVSIEQAKAAMNTRYHAIINDVEAPLQKGMSDATMAQFKARTVGIEPGRQGQSSVQKESWTPLSILFAVTSVVLLIACANVANLLLARAAGRTGEIAVRLSIGASRLQIVGQLLTESCLLAGLGGIAGLVVARWTLAAMVAWLLPADSEQVIHPQLDWSMVAFTALLSIGTGVLFGLFPALHSSRPDLVSVLKGVGGQPGGGRSASRFRWGLIGTQIALAMMLLASAGLFLKSLVNVRHVDLGVQIDNLNTFGVSPERNGYKPDRSRALFMQVEESLAAQPGVTSVAASVVPLLAGDNWNTGVSVEGFKAGPDTDTSASYNGISPGYFRTLGIGLIAGREFTASDVTGGRKVAIVNEAFLKKFGLGRDAVGKLMSESTGNGVTLDTEIVGIVPNMKYSQVKSAPPPQYYRPYRQNDTIGDLSFYFRTSLPAGQALAIPARVMGGIDRNLPVAELRTMADQVRDNVFLDRMITSLSVTFAGLATVLAAIGLYGVLAHVVAQRTREFGLRMALGADPARVRYMVLGQVGILTIIGGAIGAAAAIGVGQLASSGDLLYQVTSYDPAVLIGSTVTLSVIALAAGLVPALRASRIDPMRALRYE